MPQIYKLSPSDFAYLFQDCKYCYSLKIKEGVTLPSMPMPGVFSAINTRVQGSMVGKNLKDLSPDLPDGEVIKQEGFIDSIVIPGTNVFIKGKYDLLVKNPDGTHTLVDLKISTPGEDKIEKYKTQLGAYKFALENPKFGESTITTKLALLILYPDTVNFEKGAALLDFPLTWFDVPVDDDGFLEFIKTVDELLAGELPEESETCKWCIYRNRLAPKTETTGDIPF